MNLFANLILLPSLLMSSLMTISLSNVIQIWFIMEINNFMFISYALMTIKEKKIMFTYFIIQVLASLIMLFSMIINPIILMSSHPMLMMSLFLKVGIPPLHLWMTSLSKFMNWHALTLLLTFQKLPPLIIFYLTEITNILFMMLMIMTMIVPPISMINIKSMKMLITYSSINQTGWIIILIYLKHQMWLMYFMYYSVIVFMINLMLNKTKISLKFFQHKLKKFNLMFTVMMMNLSSMPPFSFFMFKWFSTYIMIMNSNIKMLIIIILINSLLMTFIYIKMISWSLFMKKFKSKLMYNKSNFNYNNYIFIILTLFTPLIMML
nr:TPA_asm: NADH dehydrogenase subunit 2 [Pseudomyrmex gracilis]